LELLAVNGPHSILIDTLQDDLQVPLYQESADPYPPSVARQISHEILPAWKMSSFSALVHSAIGNSAGYSHQVPDIEKITSDATPVIELESFPKGAASGDFFHAVFENIDFTGTDEDITNQVNLRFNRFGFTDDALAILAQNSVRQVIETPLETENETEPGIRPQAFKLKDIKDSQRLNELAFTFPVQSLDVPKLVRALDLSNQGFGSSGYLNQLSLLNIPKLTGYLKGFIDLIIQHDGRYYIIDYKSNYLGSTYGCYSKKNMKQAMADHHYYLQYHIYLLALHRYLSHRIKKYNYATHFGGIFYLFIRGMHPSFGSKYGVFYDRPPENLIRTLSENL
ncbi:MAG: PD-(D/E)XK nuclease family protein, partial [Desulfobacula sp.]|nr:PD-(D/E)XK nuclease family protein [Desulfobacula sp.]